MLVSSNGGRHRRPILSDIFQICLGFALAVFLFQADRTISAFGTVGTLPYAVVSKDAITAGVHMARLEVDYLVAVLNRAVRLV